MATNWYQALDQIRPFIFRIATPSGYGTGFQVLYPTAGSLCGIATAYHVIEHAEEWQEPIKITHHASGKFILLKEKDRAIFIYPSNDLAFILFDKNLLPLEKKEPKLIGPQMTLRAGAPTGWCGFPHIAPVDELCFFAGHISACLSEQDYYLVDGVAINGVSGGPAFYLDPVEDEVRICGVISAYTPNRIYGEAHPGLSKVCSVEPYQDMLKDFRSRDEAVEKAKKEKEEQEKAEDVGGGIVKEDIGGNLKKPSSSKKVSKKKSKK